MRQLPTIKALAEAKSEQIHKLWEGLGYYTRVRNLQKAARIILEKHGGKFPEDFDEVLELPGIGRYTAGAICSIAFNQPAPILDGNVVRVLTRIFGISGDPREKKINAQLWQLAGKLVDRASQASPDKSENVPACSHLNQSLMELGALICSPREPQCGSCPVARLCVACQQGRTAEIPKVRQRETATSRKFVAFVIERGGRVLVRQRPAGVVNAHLWEFPNVELNGGPSNPRAAARNLFGFAPPDLKPVCTIKHSITRYRITLEAFRVDATKSSCSEMPGRWLKLSELRKLSFPSAHKRILQTIAKPGAS